MMTDNNINSVHCMMRSDCFLELEVAPLVLHIDNTTTQGELRLLMLSSALTLTTLSLLINLPTLI